MQLVALQHTEGGTQDYRHLWGFLELFHGQTRGRGNHFGYEPYTPTLEYIPTRNADVKVALPGARLIVHRDVVSAFTNAPACVLLPCVVKRVVDMPIDEVSVRQRVRTYSVFDDSFSIAKEKRMKRVWLTWRRQYQFFEVVKPVLELYAEANKISRSHKTPLAYHDEPIFTDPRIHKAAPIVYAGYSFVFIKPLFEWVAPFLKPIEAYKITEFQIDDE